MRRQGHFTGDMRSEGAIVFVNTLQATAMHQSAPVPYQVAFIGCNEEGLHQFRLNVVRPRYASASQSVN